MNKILLKRLLFEYLEDLAHLENLVQMLEAECPPNRQPYIRLLKQLIHQSLQAAWHQREAFLALYQDEALDEAVIDICLNQAFPALEKDIRSIAEAIYRLRQVAIPAEAELYLSSLNLAKLLPDMPGPVILTDANDSPAESPFTRDSVLVESLPVTSLENPLRWFGLPAEFTRRFSEQTLQVTALLKRLHLPETPWKAVVPLINLRLLGPGFYAHYVFQSFRSRDAVALWAVEPILFQELNRFGLVNKDLVILHQSLERARFHGGLVEPEAWTHSLGKMDTAETILKVVEKVVPERLAYTEKSLLRSQLLEERLSTGMLISAVPMLSSPAQLREDLTHLDEVDSVYPILGQLQEAPATPREIINAGWLYKLDESPGWLQSALESDSNIGWEWFTRKVLEMDTILLKSIEISEVHRVLAFEESDVPLPV